MSVIHQLRDAQRAHCGDFKPAALESKRKSWHCTGDNMQVYENMSMLRCVWYFYSQPGK